MLVADGAAMVTDFGVAKALSSATGMPSQSGTTMTGVGIALGTPAYMAPEQIAADPETVRSATSMSFTRSIRHSWRRGPDP